ncbi:MAG TPA: MarR family transcriptional regulator [Gaiellaceae bacterium]|jgi:DNA-binding MarR family transcriptional regulator
MSPRPRRQTSPRRAAELLARTAPLVGLRLERLLGGHEPRLTLAQYQALGTIEEGEILGSELAQRTAVSAAAVSQLVGSLEAAGLVERLRSPDDRRRQTLVLTETGRVVLASARRLVAEHLAALLRDLPPPEVDALVRGLERLDALLAGRAPPPRPPRPHPPRPPHPPGPDRPRQPPPKRS